MSFFATTSASREAMLTEKRSLERDHASRDGMSDQKRQRPTLANEIVEAVKMDSLQKLCSTLEPLLRRVVGEEVERALAKFAPPKAGFRSSPKRIQGPDQRNLRLQFRNKLALPLFTGSKVEGEHGTAIHVMLLDASTSQVVTAGPESSAKLDVVVLEGDFAVDDEDNWKQVDFENAMVRERDGKRPLLTGELSVTLKDGVGTLGDLTFTDNSSWIRSRKFRLAVKICSGFCEGLRIREAKTEAFIVKDHRGELYKKHYPPALNDEVWRLDKIGKDGAFHKRLNQAKIMTVEDFLRLVVMDPQRLRNILGNGMSNKMWEGTVEHAKTCVLSGKLYVYYADEKQNIGVIFNNIFQLMGLIADGSYMSVDSLSDNEKVYVDKLVKVAYENWENVVEYDGEALVGAPVLKGIDIKTVDPVTTSVANSLLLQSHGSSQQLTLSQLLQPELTPLEQWPPTSSAGSGAVMPQYDPNSLATRAYGQLTQVPDPNQNILMGSELQINSNMESRHQSFVSSSSQQNYIGNVGMTGLALGLPKSSLTASSPAFSAGDAGTAPGMMNPSSGGIEWQSDVQDNYAQGFNLFEELPSEDELRARSLEFLENEDMHTQIQQLLQMFSTVEAPLADYNLSGSRYGGPTAGSQETRANGKAFVGWLKLKAAVRWGIFVRKQAAARRAQLEEVEDD
ncbi:hypothetical protein CY35_05G099300 [Sphagnum magellanicum]|nr:hypothetical protein CY35_05G099300 [Sphagnum magellanicum]KAH9562951.1 hypothetical protein CY35_05G099300 [Sphagnum magellanicum]